MKSFMALPEIVSAWLYTGHESKAEIKTLFPGVVIEYEDYRTWRLRFPENHGPKGNLINGEFTVSAGEWIIRRNNGAMSIIDDCEFKTAYIEYDKDKTALAANLLTCHISQPHNDIEGKKSLRTMSIVALLINGVRVIIPCQFHTIYNQSISKAFGRLNPAKSTMRRTP